MYAASLSRPNDVARWTVWTDIKIDAPNLLVFGFASAFSLITIHLDRSIHPHLISTIWPGRIIHLDIIRSL
jgi:hypothetical protein